MAKDRISHLFGEDMLKNFQDMKLPMFDPKTLSSFYERNMELINSSQKITAQAAQAMLDLQSKYYKTIFDQWNHEVQKCMSDAPLEEKTSCQAECNKAMLDKTVEHAKNMNDILEQSNKKIVDNLQKHFQGAMHDSAHLAEKLNPTKH